MYRVIHFLLGIMLNLLKKLLIHWDFDDASIFKRNFIELQSLNKNYVSVIHFNFSPDFDKNLQKLRFALVILTHKVHVSLSSHCSLKKTSF